MFANIFVNSDWLVYIFASPQVLFARNDYMFILFVYIMISPATTIVICYSKA